MTTNGYSGLWNGQYSTQHAPLGNSVNKESAYAALTTMFGKRGYNQAKVRELIKELLGASAGATALVQRKRRKAEQDLGANVQGGLVTIETVDVINRATTAADVTRIQEALEQERAPSSYVADVSGNGGGGKLNY